MIDERQFRKGPIDEESSQRVRFGDGSEFLVPKPWVELRGSFRGRRTAAFTPFVTYGPETEERITLIHAEESPERRIALVAELAATLLLQSYELTDSQLDKLLSVRLDDPESWDWIKHVIDIATGRSGPKRTRAGSG